MLNLRVASLSGKWNPVENLIRNPFPLAAWRRFEMRPSRWYKTVRRFARSSSLDCLVCASCSSGQGFAGSFLPTMPRDTAAAVRLAVPTITVRRGLSPYSHAPCPAHNDKGRLIQSPLSRYHICGLGLATDYCYKNATVLRITIRQVLSLPDEL